MKAKPKAKAKSRAKAKKANASGAIGSKAAKKKDCKNSDPNPVEMRRQVTKIVDGELDDITGATVGEAKKGQLATVKYLFELVGIYPPSAEGIVDRPEEDTLAQRLVRRLGLPEGPLPNEDDDPPEQLVIPMAKDDGASVARAENRMSGGVTDREVVENGEAAAESEAGLGNAVSD